MKWSSRTVVAAVGLVGLTRALMAWAQSDATVQMLHPVDGATEVAPNTGLALRFRLKSLTGGGAPSDLVSLRNERGERLAIGELSVIDEDRGVQVFTAPLALAANARYEVLTRVTPACDDRARLENCLATDEDAVVIAEFSTGDARDETAPKIVDASGEKVKLLFAWGVAPCLWQVNVDVEDDQAPAAGIRYELAGNPTQVILTNDGKLDLKLWGGTEAEKDGITLTPIDPSGNRGEPFTLDVPECPFVDNGGDAPVGTAVPADDAMAAQSPRAEGCSVTHGGASSRGVRSTGAGSSSAVLFLAFALGASCVRRQRR